LGIGTIWAGAYKQSIVAKSAGEAELISASDNGSILLKARHFLISQGYEIGSAVYELYNTSLDSKTERVKIHFCPTEEMMADILLKALQGSTFAHLRDVLLGRSPVSVLFSMAPLPPPIAYIGNC
jgi:hypothetical protein